MNKNKFKEALKALKAETKTLCELRNANAPDGEYFFAFNSKQFEEGKKQIKIKDESLLKSCGAGMYGTQKGIDEFWAFHDGKTKQIQEQISPLAFFYYEYGNHEGEYSAYGEAWELTQAVYPNFDFNEKNNAEIIAAIRKEWKDLNSL